MNFENVKLIPRKLSTVKSRNDVDLSIPFGNVKLRLPLLISPMNTVTGIEMSKLLTKNNLIGCLPRLGTWRNSLETYVKVPSPCIVAIGLDDYNIAEDLYQYGNIRYFLIDTANGFNTSVMSIIEKLKKLKDVFIIAGNVASAEGYAYLADLGVDAVRCGIGCGSPCSTTVNTGIGCSLVESIQDCYAASLFMAHPPLIIADGGIKNVGDIAKILALGADLAMVGSLFAGCKECPGKVIVYNEKRYKPYHGSASYAVQAAHKDVPYYIEGIESLKRYKGTAQNVINQIDAGLRSSLSYMGAFTIEEFRENCQNNNCIRFCAERKNNEKICHSRRD